nr:hypothetical protein [Tanacetum cinerariifolium]
MLYCFFNKIHVDYADLLWEGLHYLLEHPSTLTPYPRFTKLIVSHYMTTFLEISHRVCDKYHNLEDDEMVKSIFNSWKNKAGGRCSYDLVITDTTNAPRTLNPDVDEGESSAPQNSTVIRLRIPLRRSNRLTPPTPILTTIEADDIILQDTIQLSLAEQKIHDKLEANQNVQKVKEHLIAEEIEKLVEGTENVENVKVDSSTLRQNDNQNVLDTRLEPRSNKKSPEVEITTEVQLVNVNEEDEESAEDDLNKVHAKKKFHELAQHLQEVMEESLPKMVDAHVQELTKTQVSIYVAQELILERQQNQADVGKMIADVIEQDRENLRAKISLQINNAIINHIPSQVDSSVMNYMSGHILHVYPTQASLSFAQEQQYQLYVTMKDNPQLQHNDLPIWLALKYKFKRLHVSNTPYDDELPTEKVSQELMEEMSLTVDETKLRKVVNEMLRQ